MKYYYYYFLNSFLFIISGLIYTVSYCGPETVKGSFCSEYAVPVLIVIFIATSLTEALTRIAKIKSKPVHIWGTILALITFNLIIHISDYKGCTIGIIYGAMFMQGWFIVAFLFYIIRKAVLRKKLTTHDLFHIYRFHIHKFPNTV